MIEPVKRFSSRVENYVKYRPGYPPEVIDLLVSECGLSQNSIVADVGSGTGFLTELFLRNGNKVFGVEPNREMRTAAESYLNDHPNFKSVDAKAESTSLAGTTIDFITVGQAFHWFDQQQARREFLRILKPDGWTVLIWNERRVDANDFLRALEELFLKFGTLYDQVRHENVYSDITAFFGTEDFRLATFENLQHQDLDAFKGRIFSTSYSPEPGQSNFEPMVAQMLAIFSTYQQQDKVTIEYDTKVYYGQMNPAIIETTAP